MQPRAKRTPLYDLLALIGLILLILGMLGVARLIRSSAASTGAETGFLPITVQIGQSGHAPPVAYLDNPLVPPASDEAQPTAQPEAPSSAAPIAAAQPDPRSLEPSVKPTAVPLIPEWLDIPRLKLQAPIVTVAARAVDVNGVAYQQWDAPSLFAAGWQEGSARIGEVGNIVLNGHHNVHEMVFARLKDLKSGDEIILTAQGREVHYAVAQTMILKERDATLAERTANALWILPSDDQRLTLVTCWPPDNNTHRLIVVAVPIQPATAVAP